LTVSKEEVVVREAEVIMFAERLDSKDENLWIVCEIGLEDMES
jgi:hypothetical protein